jgi:hypothetical protein
MYIQNQETINTKRLMTKINTESEERRRIVQDDIRLCRELRKMNQEALSIQRSKNKKRIARYNKLFFKKIEELTRLRSNQATVKDKEINNLIKEWKKNSFIS